MKKIKELYGDNIPALLYGIIITIVTLIPYIPDNYIAVFAAALFISIIYIGLNKLSIGKRKIACVLLYLVAFALVAASFNINIAGTGFYMWLLTGYDYNVLFIPYIVILSGVCIIFFGVSSYYFTTFYFRGYIMIFMLMIPVALYYKIIETIPVLYVSAVAISLIYLYIVQEQKRNLYGESINVNPPFKRFAAALFGMIIIITIVVPKSEVAEKRDVFDDLIAMNPFSKRNLNAIANLSEKSAAGSYGYLNQSKVVYILNAYEPLYLRRSSYKNYEGEYFENEYISEYSDWRETVKDHDMRSFYENMTVLYEEHQDIFDKYGISKDDIPNVTEESMSVVITPKSFNADYFVGPVRTFDIKTNDIYETVVKNNAGALYFSSRHSIGYDSYTVEYYRDIARENKEILNFADKFSFNMYYSFITELESAERENGGEYEEWLDEILIEVTDASIFMNSNGIYSERMYELACDITKDCRTDYEKAEAIERYFKENDYAYNISYEPDEPGIEYFIFNSKEGGCREFATAMTLMSQAVGVCARYTEGFVSEKTYSDGTYYVTAGDSHAYVEVYIPGYGYTAFEPTVSDGGSSTAGIISDTISRFSDIVRLTKDSAIYFVVAGAVVIVLFLLFKLFLIRVIKDRLMVLFCMKSRKQEYMVYKYIQKMVEPYTDIPVESMTPAEVDKFLKIKAEIDISELTKAVENRAYGNGKGVISRQFIRKMPEIRKKIVTVFNDTKRR